MKKILILIATIVAIIFSTQTADAATHAGASATLKPETSNVQVTDKRVIALENIFKKYNSPLVPYADSYVAIADKHGVDWKLLPSIAGLESGFGRAMIDETYNPYGWGSGRIYFESWEDGIDTVNAGLAKRYYARGADTIYEIGPIYAESPTWAVRVTHFSDMINAEYLRLASQNLALNI